MKTAQERLKELIKLAELPSPNKFDYLLEAVPNRIRIRTRLGKGLLGKLKELSPKYKKFREGFNELHSETTSNRSNLTLTGEMLYSIIGKRKEYSFKFIFANDASDMKAYWASKTGRPFFELLPSERNGIQREISEIIMKNLRAIFKG